MKQHTLNRKRRLTAAQKQLVSAAGLDPKQFLYSGENDYYLFLVDRATSDPKSVPKLYN